MIKRIFWLCVAITLNSFLADSQNYQPITYDGEVFNTTYHITFEDNQDCKEWHDSIRAIFQNFDLSLSMFNSESIISAMNNNIPKTKANECVKNVIVKSLEVSKRTSGAFDITVAPLVNLWGFGFKNKEKVTQEAVDSILQFVGYDKIRLDKNGYLHKQDSRIQLDASSIAKGYICDIIGNWLNSKGVNNYMVEIGGEIALHGKSPKGKSWRIGINVPEDDIFQRINGIEGILELTDGGIATSGNYRNFYYQDGRKYAHTIDPSTGYPVQKNILSSTVIASDCITADAYATAFMVMGVEKALKILEKDESLMAYFIIADEKSNNSYKVVFSDNLKKILAKGQQIE